MTIFIFLVSLNKVFVYIAQHLCIKVYPLFLFILRYKDFIILLFGGFSLPNAVIKQKSRWHTSRPNIKVLYFC